MVDYGCLELGICGVLVICGWDWLDTRLSFVEVSISATREAMEGRLDGLSFGNSAYLLYAQ